MRIAVAMSGLLLALLLLHDYAVAGDVFEAAVVGHRAAVEGLASYTCHIEVTRYKLPAGPERRFVGKYWRWGGEVPLPGDVAWKRHSEYRKDHGV
jgi:hypothetical protein